jgi:hypothetical protein
VPTCFNYIHPANANNPYPLSNTHWGVQNLTCFAFLFAPDEGLLPPSDSTRLAFIPCIFFKIVAFFSNSGRTINFI